jgi:hypothetical protein
MFMGSSMKRRRSIRSHLAILTAVASLAVFSSASAQQAAVAIDNDDIGGVVRGPSGPEAGVWVIAETHRIADKIHQDRCHR